MPTSVGPNTFGEENLVFGYDTGDTVNSYKGQPVHSIIRPLDEWTISNRINIEEVSGSDWNSPVPGARMWKCYYTSSNASNSLTRDYEGNNPLMLSGSFGKGLHLYSMWVRGFNTNPAGSQIEIDISDRNVSQDTPLTDEVWRKVSTIDSDSNTTANNFHDIFVAPTNSTKVDFLITGIMLVRSSGSTYQELTPITNTNIQWLPEGAIREVDESLVDLTGNSTIDLTNVSFDSNAQMTFDGTDDQINLGTQYGTDFDNTTNSFTVESIFKVPADHNKTTSGTIFGRYRYSLNYAYSTVANTLGNISFIYIDKDYDDSSVYSTNTVSTSANLNTKGNWNHVTATYTRTGDSGSLQMYVNGELSATNNGLRMGNYPLLDALIGNSQHLSSTYYWLEGDVATLKAYNRALTASEIKANYNAIKGRFNI